MAGDTGEFVLEYVNPFALLYMLAAVSLHFFKLLEWCMTRAGGCLRLCFYNDKVTPRNNLRPDHAGSFEALYWTILDFPQWVRTRGVLKWFRFAYCLEQDLEDAEASISVVMKHVLKVSFKPDRDPMDHG